MPIQHLRHHTRTPAGADHMNNDITILKHPVPLRPSADAHRGFIRTDHPRTTQARQDAGHIGIEAWFATAEGRIQRALADTQSIQVQHHPTEPPIADGMDKAQIHRQCDDTEAERCARFKPVRHGRQRGSPAALAVPRIALDPCDHRLNLG
jgi:hypothetical protein